MHACICACQQSLIIVCHGQSLACMINYMKCQVYTRVVPLCSNNYTEGHDLKIWRVSGALVHQGASACAHGSASNIPTNASLICSWQFIIIYSAFICLALLLI